MNILLINGSPKGERSNTLKLANAFIEGICHAQKECLPEIERIDISQMDINSCLGCFSCWKTTPGKCCIHDDMQNVLEKLLWADLTILSFPLYYFSLPGKLKTVIDRQLPLSLPFMLSDAEVPLLFYKSKKTIYDVTSCTLVSIFSILLLINLSPVIVVPLSYFAFGLMWSISVFLKVPLTAEYSLNDYGGDKALQNPMFIRTNRILTAAWGALYLVTPIWTYFIMCTAVGSYIGIINSILPAIMGAFTKWFQKWYPQKIARGESKSFLASDHNGKNK